MSAVRTRLGACRLLHSDHLRFAALAFGRGFAAAFCDIAVSSVGEGLRCQSIESLLEFDERLLVNHTNSTVLHLEHVLRAFENSDLQIDRGKFCSHGISHVIRQYAYVTLLLGLLPLVGNFVGECACASSSHLSESTCFWLCKCHRADHKI
jgi:hypothetical protein